MPRFVILEHDHPQLHWDFMLEVGEVLWTWRLATAPRGGPETIAAERIGDHRKLYLDYEGPLSGARGAVKRWDAGTYEPIELAAAKLTVRLHGHRLVGLATLEQSGAGEGLKALRKSQSSGVARGSWGVVCVDGY